MNRFELSIARKTVMVMLSIGVLLAGLLLHELGHLLFIWLNGCDGVISYGYVQSLGFETFYIDGDFSGLNTILLCLSGGVFAGVVILLIGLRFKWLLWVGVYHLLIGLFEYTGIGPVERLVLDSVFIIGIITSIIFMRGGG